MQGRNMVSVVIDQLGNRNPTFFPTTMRSPCCVGINSPSLRSYRRQDDTCYWKETARVREFNSGPIASLILLLR
jgi:hypothetical protein